MNRLRILDAVREHGALTQVEIAELTGLSPATVSNLVKELAAAEAVELTPSVRNGRRAVQVALTAPSGLVGAVVFGHRDIRVAIAGDDQNVLARSRMPLAAAYAPDEELPRAARLLAELAGSSGHSLGEVRAVTAGLPAPIDAVTGQVGADGVLPRWRGIPVGPTLAELIGVPVQLDNSANLAALGESCFGVLQGVDTGVYVAASHGIGAGLIIGGEVYRGSAGTAGEIGHLTIDEHGPVCRCGNRGCLDTFVGSDALLALMRPTHGDLTFRDVINRAMAGDPGCRRVLGDAGRHVGVALAGLVNLLNPEVIAIGGQMAQLGDLVLEPIRDVIERRAIPSAVHTVRIVAAELRPDEADVAGALVQANRVRRAEDLAALAAV